MCFDWLKDTAWFITITTTIIMILLFLLLLFRISWNEYIALTKEKCKIKKENGDHKRMKASRVHNHKNKINNSFNYNIFLHKFFTFKNLNLIEEDIKLSQ